MAEERDEKTEVLPQENELETAKKARDDAQKELLYARAEFENTKRRLLREQEQAIKFANEKFISELLPVADLLERGLAHKESKDFITGVEITLAELNQLLSRFGVEFIGVAGEKFDPARHEAVSQREASPEQQGTVLEVFQRGSLYNGRLLKPAKVVVAKS